MTGISIPPMKLLNSLLRKSLARVARITPLLTCALLVAGPASAWADARNFQASWTTVGGSLKTADFRIYTPAAIDSPRIRGVIFLYPGSGGDWRFRADDVVWQEAARSLGFALVGVGSNGGYTSISETEARASLNAILASAAAVTGRAEIVNAPIVSTGFSLGGFVSTEYANEVPERVIAAVGQRGSTAFLSNHAAESRNVPTLFIPGSLDTNGLTNPNVTASNFASWRANGGHAAYAVDWRTPHDTFVNQSWSMAWTWIAESIKLRYDEGIVPSTTAGNPVALADIPLESGWLGQRAYVTSTTGADRSSFVEIAPYSEYSQNPAQASWLPNEAVARAYQAMTSYDGNTTRTGIPLQGPLSIDGDAAPSSTIQPGQVNPPQLAVKNVGETITISVSPREFDDARSIVSMEYYDGDQLLGTQTNPNSSGWNWDHTLSTKGIHTLTVVATDSAGNKSSAFRTVVAAAEHLRGTSYYRFEVSPGLATDHYDILNLNRGATVGTGPQRVLLTSTGPGSYFPKQFQFAQGQNESAAKFVAANYEWFNHADSAELPSGTTSFTVEAFINLSSAGAGGLFRSIASHGGSSTTDAGWQLIVTGEGSGLGARNLVFQFTPDGKGQTAGSLDTIDSDIQIQVGLDYYIAFVFNPTDRSTEGARFFVKDLTNGGPLLEFGRTHTKTSVWDSSLTFTVGAGWDGLLDEVRLTSRALDSSELLINQVVPEPGVVSLLALAFLGGVLYRRRKAYL